MIPGRLPPALRGQPRTLGPSLYQKHRITSPGIASPGITCDLHSPGGIDGPPAAPAGHAGYRSPGPPAFCGGSDGDYTVLSSSGWDKGWVPGVMRCAESAGAGVAGDYLAGSRCEPRGGGLAESSGASAAPGVHGGGKKIRYAQIASPAPTTAPDATSPT